MRFRSAMVFAMVGMFAAIAGCNGQKNAADNKQNRLPEPAVVVAPVTTRPVAASVEFIGQAKAFQSVDLRARVTGFLLERSFKEGNDVKKGDPLFIIDPSQYEAAQEAAAARAAGAKATIREAENQLKRYMPLIDSGTITVAKLDEAKASAGRARADFAAAQADLKKMELDVGYTIISSPIDGRIGGSAVDVGNLIGPDSGVLATVVALDPIQVNFSVSEREYLNYAETRMKGDVIKLTPKIRLANERTYPYDGTIDYVENRVDPSTGTIRIRAEFPNPDSLILPGQFLNLTLVSSDPQEQVVVPQAAVQANQAGPFVLVVDGDNVVEQRPVKTGQLVGTQIAVTEGLEAGETIIVEGIQKVRPGARVKPVMQKAAR
ncbi:MAG: efflux RND transporter periplasmic adaptor subunit [Hyphomicrobiales bacterium]|nr:efflux RND transporter periplasmic adaptor subunit [Hyphomicrobiales bacterium]